MTIGRAATLILAAMLLPACQKHEPVPLPEAKANPFPKDKYEISVLTYLETAVDGVTGAAVYEIANTQCIPIDYTRSLGGSRPMFLEEVDIQYGKTGDRSFAGDLYGDYFSDENYYELGPCRWKISSVTARLVVQGKPYVVSIGGMKLRKEESQDIYCLKPDLYASIGYANCVFEQALGTSKFGRNDYLKVTLIPKRI